MGTPGQGQQERRPGPEKDLAWQLRKYLLLLAILVIETKDGHRTGNPILPGTRPLRYKLFYYFNATAFAASLVVSILLLFMKHEDHVRPLAVRGIMVIDVCCLMLAYVAGSCRGRLTTIYVPRWSAPLSSYSSS
ncbi:hypothetical protein EJB05_51164, partial [Eragrostis curvula]